MFRYIMKYVGAEYFFKLLPEVVAGCDVGQGAQDCDGGEGSYACVMALLF